MSKIYTKTGDKGQTSLFDGTRVPKNHLRVDTYGTVDELNAVLGVVLTEILNFKFQISNLQLELEHIQNDLFEIGTLLANPTITHNLQPTTYLDTRIHEFEQLIDTLTEELPLLTNFILPGGGKAGSQLQVARTVARRAERRIIELSQTVSVDGSIIRYFNRLSDLLFTMSRYVNFKEKKKETIWEKAF